MQRYLIAAIKCHLPHLIVTQQKRPVKGEDICIENKQQQFSYSRQFHESLIIADQLSHSPIEIPYVDRMPL